MCSGFPPAILLLSFINLRNIIILLIALRTLSIRAVDLPEYPDIIDCDRAYGENLDYQSCIRALHTMPSSDDPTWYYFPTADIHVEALNPRIQLPKLYADPLSAGSPQDPHTTCGILLNVEPGHQELFVPSLVPTRDVLRMAARVLSACTQNSRQGGFMTHGIDRTMSWFFHPQYQAAPKPFMTITVAPMAQLSQAGGPPRPGSTDPLVAYAMSTAIIMQLGNNPFADAVAGQVAIEAAWKRLMLNVERMRPGGLVSWTDGLYPLQFVQGQLVRGNWYWRGYLEQDM